MPGLTRDFEVLLDFTNDTADAATVQPQRDYGRDPSSAVLLRPGESVTLVLDAGAAYRYCLKTRSHVANVTARSWRDVQFDMSRVFPAGAAAWPPPSALAHDVAGVTVDKLWRDVRFCMWHDA